VIVVVAVLAAGGMFAGRRTTHVVDRTYVADPVDTVDEVVEEPVATRRVVRRRRIVR